MRLIGLARLPARQSDPGPLAVEIFESPGRDYLRDLTDFGPAWYLSREQSLQGVEDARDDYSPETQRQISLTTFLDFAIGASECLELLHHGLKVVHGELRADAFHFNRDTGVVKLVNFGSGPKSFENSGGLTSSGWSTLSRQKGIKTRLVSQLSKLLLPSVSQVITLRYSLRAQRGSISLSSRGIFSKVYGTT